MPRKTIPDQLFNTALKTETGAVADTYQAQAYTQPTEYIRVVGEGADGLSVGFTLVIEPTDKTLPALMRKLGAVCALDHPDFEPLAIFVVQASLTLQPNVLGAQPQQALTVYGITNDARFNLSVLHAEYDEDGRLYVVPTELFNWEPEPSNVFVDVLPYLEFFKAFDGVRQQVPV